MQSLEIVYIEDYALAIDKEAEIKDGDYKYENGQLVRVIIRPTKVISNKIIAYYPLTKEAKELDLPLLPNPFENKINLKKMSLEAINNFNSEFYKANGLKDWLKIPDARTGFELGYEAAQSKQFSLEDMKKCWDECYQSLRYTVDVKDGKLAFREEQFNKYREEYFQSLSTQQLPKEFIPEYTDNHSPYYDGIFNTIKTITNSKGKQQLVGIYK